MQRQGSAHGTLRVAVEGTGARAAWWACVALVAAVRRLALPVLTMEEGRERSGMSEIATNEAPKWKLRFRGARKTQAAVVVQWAVEEA